MDEAALVEMLKSGENEELATCELLDDNEIAKHICALTNTKGGTLIIGVRKLARPLPNGAWFELRGVPKMRNTEDQFMKIGKSLKPGVSIDLLLVNLVSRENARCVIATVERHGQDSHTKTKEGIAYLRFKNETVPEGIAHVTISPLAAELMKQFEQLDDIAQDRVKAAVYEKFSAAIGHSLNSIVLNGDWAEFVAEFLENENATYIDPSDALHQIIEGSRQDEIAFFADANADAIALAISALANTRGGHVIAGVRESSSGLQFIGITEGSIRKLASLSRMFPPGTFTVETFQQIENRTIWHAIVEKSSSIVPAPDDLNTYLRRDGDINIRESLPSHATDTFEAQVTPDDDAQEPFVDSSPHAKALRKGITSEFDSLTKDMKLAFARTQLGTGPMQPEWESNFYDSLNYSTTAKLEKVARELAEFKRTKGRVHGNVNEYRREATTEEECLNLDTYTRVLSHFFASAKEDVCFGIFGHWGRGKTHLMKKVGKRLEDDHNYRVVRFSAWKYRTNPELWIYLYECIASLARKEHWFDARIAIPVRAAFSRFGLWGLTISLLVLAVALTPLLARIQYATSVIFWLGIGPSLYLLLIYTRLRSFAVTLKPYFLIPDHAGKLGLQATIGADLRALLLGWMPQNTWMKPSRKTELCKHLRVTGKGVESFAYTIMVILVAVQPWFYSGAFPLGVFFAVVWTGLALGLPIFALLRSSSPNRILLVIDDLDRCESKQMLEIIESIMLLLDDVEVQNRLQVVMLVEEEAVEYAISLKYQHYWRNLKNNSRLEKKRALIDENMQKLFLAYLRLGQLNTSEIQEVAESYLQVSHGFTYEDNVAAAYLSEIPSPVESSQSESKSNSTTLDSNPIDAPSTPSSTLEDASSEQQQFKFGEVEKHAIVEAIRTKSDQSRWGPRAIRCFIHKYQLARELLVEIHPSNEIDPRELVEKLLTPESTLGPRPPSLIEHMPYKGADYVVRQVK